MSLFWWKTVVLTVRVGVSDQELQHLVHGAHEEDEPQLGHRHSDEAPQEDGRAHGAAERHRACGWRVKDIV